MRDQCGGVGSGCRCESETAAPDRPGAYQVEPPSAVQPPVRPAPDRPGDRDQQQAAEAQYVWQRVAHHYGATGEVTLPYERLTVAIAVALAAARAEEAARWQAKIEALADEWLTEGCGQAARDRNGISDEAWLRLVAADRLRVLAGER